MLLCEPNLLAKTIAAAFERLSQSFKDGQQNKLSDSDIQLLRSLFGGDLLQRSLEILDRCGPTGITCYRPAGDSTAAADSLAASERSVFEVPASSRTSTNVYKLLPGINYCTCASYRHRVQQPTTSVAASTKQPPHSPVAAFTCKHVLACKLAVLLGRLNVITCTRDELNVHLDHVLTTTTTTTAGV